MLVVLIRESLTLNIGNATNGDSRSIILNIGNVVIGVGYYMLLMIDSTEAELADRS